MTRNPATGVALGSLGGFALSFDIPMIRLSGADTWTTLAVRGGAIALAMFAVWLFTRRRNAANPFADRDWLAVGTAWGIANILFTFAVFRTSTANLVFILAFNPMLAAMMSWAIIGERPAAATFAAIAATTLGVGVIVRGGLGGGSGAGDLLALGCAAAIAFSLVWSHRSGKDMSLAPGLGSLISAAVALPLAGGALAMPQEPAWLLANGFLVIPFASWCLALAPRFIAAEQVAMFYLLETVLAPVWVWLVFAETPPAATLAGGAIVLGAIALHSVWSLRAAAPALRDGGGT